MNLEQFNEIVNKLKAWREERGLSVEDQKRNFKVNYTKELLEYYEAERDGNEYEMIDALCDMIVVAINAGLDYRSSGIIESLTIMMSINSRQIVPPNAISDINICYIMAMLQLKGYDPYLCLLETIKELESRTGAWNEKEGKWIKNIGAYTFEEAENIVSEYDTENERELYEDNTEFWRWQLHIKGEYFSLKVKKWYKADYSKCKLNQRRENGDQRSYYSRYRKSKRVRRL